MATFCQLQKGMLIGGHYKVTKFLGQGSMGAVYQAQDEYFAGYNRQVAIKLLPKELRQEAGREAYFKREFLTSQELVHQNICCTYEFGEDSSLQTYYLVMEYVSGKTLRDCIRQKDYYALEEALPIIEQIAKGLDYAHARGVVHLDMKPDNIMVSDRKEVKIMDFGLSRVINSNMTHVSLSEFEGTPLYMSPEQVDPMVARKKITQSTDCWAFGVIVYEMLAGYPPFDGRMGVTPLMQSILHADPERISHLSPPAWMAIKKMLSKVPKDRFENCTQLYQTLMVNLATNQAQENVQGQNIAPLPSPGQIVGQGSMTQIPEDVVFPGTVSPQRSSMFMETVAGSRLATNAPTVLFDKQQNTQLATHVNSGIESGIEKGQQLVARNTQTAGLQMGTYCGREKKHLVITRYDVEKRYKEPKDIEKADQTPGFHFLGVNVEHYMVYRHRQTGMDFVLIPSGSFYMGSQKGQGNSDEFPRHRVYLDAYLISTTPLTQEIWEKIMGENPSRFKKGGKYPVEQIDWDDLQEFCRLVSLDIPTEAQWENACRGGTETIYYWGNEPDYRYFWCNENSAGYTHPVASKEPNGFGLYDMCGNVWEWCKDGYVENSYQYHDPQNPVFTKDYRYRVRRGGSWINKEKSCRCATRAYDEPGYRASGLGGRVVRCLY